MDALLANYGSDDDGSDEEQQQQQPGTSTSGRPVEDSRKGTPVGASNQIVPTRPSLFGKLPPPKTREEAVKAEIGSKSSSLFSALPLPKTPGGRALPGQNLGATISSIRDRPSAEKRVVKVHLPVKTLHLVNDEEDEDTWRPSKKLAVEKDSGERDEKAESGVASGGGLFAILPAPKHSSSESASLGAGLGKGSGRIVLDLEKTVEPHSSRALQAPPAQMPVQEDFVEQQQHVAVNASEWGGVEGEDGGSFSHWDGASGDGSLAYAGEGMQSYGQAGLGMTHGGSTVWGYGGGEHLAAENGGFGGERGLGGGGQGWGGAPPVAEVNGELAKALAEDEERMRRKGRGRDAAPQFVEVKQANLLGGGAMREDKLRLTGIAFGPAHQAAAAASKEKKPDKMHRRKHQIGALYYDMKQRELETLERRAKGMMSKAETQAKYGW